MYKCNFEFFYFLPSQIYLISKISLLYSLQGMRMSGESSEILHLTQLARESAGAYACGAANTEGETRSSSLTLKVQCKFLIYIHIFTEHLHAYLYDFFFFNLFENL